MEKRIFLFKVLVILLLIYFIIAVGAFFKSYKQASAENYNLTPTTILFDISTEEESRVLPKLIPDYSKNLTYGQGMTQRNARGFREI